MRDASLFLTAILIENMGGGGLGGQIFILDKDGVRRGSIWFVLKQIKDKVKDKDLIPALRF